MQYSSINFAKKTMKSFCLADLSEYRSKKTVEPNNEDQSVISHSSDKGVLDDYHGAYFCKSYTTEEIL